MNFSAFLTYIRIRGDNMYPNPYMMTSATKAGLLSKGLSSLKTVNWGSLLEGTQKTLGVINQAIPVVYQIKPIINNAKTIFKIAGSMQEEPNNTVTETSEIIKTDITPIESSNQSNSPIFYI